MGNGFLLIIVGLLLFYVVISDKFYCLAGAAACLTGKYQNGEAAGSGPNLIGNASGFTPTIQGVFGVGRGSAGVFPPR